MGEQPQPEDADERRLAQFALEALFSDEESATVDGSVADVDSASMLNALRIALQELERLDLEE
ncbi:MAG: hypothetical protein ACE361_24815 [Aureliella sp.]